MKKVRIGVLGGYRGTSMINYCKAAANAEVVAICDKYDDVLEKQKAMPGTENVTFYKDFEDFIRHDMDAVVLANYANEHAPFAIRCLKAGLHVFSECLPCQTMKEAVELVEAVEESGLIYAYGENYCYMAAPYEMKRLYEAGEIGEFDYAECEYVHNCRPFWGSITYGDKNHWRNNMYSTFYCTHSLGPIIHITGLRPVSVVGFEGQHVAGARAVGSKAGQFGMEMVTLENGGLIKSLHGGLSRNSDWYCVYGSRGRLESARKDAETGEVDRIYVHAGDVYDEFAPVQNIKTYLPRREFDHIAKDFGHAGSDFYCMYHFVQKILGDETADTIDVYEALDSFLPGLCAYFSVLQGGTPVEVPNMREKAVRDQYRNDTRCTDPKAAGDQLLPTFSKGTPEIPDEVYRRMYDQWQLDLVSDSGYTHAAMTQGAASEDEGSHL